MLPNYSSECDCQDYCAWCHPEMCLEEKKVIVNYYIQLPGFKNVEYETRALQTFLISHGFQVFDATPYDSLTSGFNKASSLDEIEKELKGE